MELFLHPWVSNPYVFLSQVPSRLSKLSNVTK